MHKVLISIFALTITSGCARVSESNLNPVNWFNKQTATSAPTEIPPIIPQHKIPAKPYEGRALVSDISHVEVRDVSGGVLVTAQGYASHQRAFNVQLVNEGIKDGVLTLAFRVQYPNTQTLHTKTTVTAAQFLSERKMRGVKAVHIRAANGVTTRRY